MRFMADTATHYRHLCVVGNIENEGMYDPDRNAGGENGYVYPHCYGLLLHTQVYEALLEAGARRDGSAGYQSRTRLYHQDLNTVIKVLKQVHQEEAWAEQYIGQDALPLTLRVEEQTAFPLMLLLEGTTRFDPMLYASRNSMRYRQMYAAR